ncbi:MAG: YciE/YciF ferroxidase family protein [Minisyncoccota bacterium]
MDTLNKLFLTKIKALYDMEQELVEQLPKLAKAATDKNLKKALDDHQKETEEQAERLEAIFDILAETPDRLEGDAIRGMVKDAEWVIKNTEKGETLDLALIGVASHVEHYEMAGYMSASMIAEQLGQAEIIDLLDMTSSEEEALDIKITEIAAKIIEKIS